MKNIAKLILGLMVASGMYAADTKLQQQVPAEILQPCSDKNYGQGLYRLTVLPDLQIEGAALTKTGSPHSFNLAEHAEKLAVKESAKLSNGHYKKMSSGYYRIKVIEPKTKYKINIIICCNGRCYNDPNKKYGAIYLQDPTSEKILFGWEDLNDGTRQQITDPENAIMREDVVWPLTPAKPSVVSIAHALQPAPAATAEAADSVADLLRTSGQVDPIGFDKISNAIRESDPMPATALLAPAASTAVTPPASSLSSLTPAAATAVNGADSAGKTGRPIVKSNVLRNSFIGAVVVGAAFAIKYRAQLAKLMRTTKKVVMG